MYNDIYMGIHILYMYYFWDGLQPPTGTGCLTNHMEVLLLLSNRLEALKLHPPDKGSRQSKGMCKALEAKIRANEKGLPATG